MGIRYQLATADGDPDWTPGTPRFGGTKPNAYDRARFHTGRGWRIAKRGDDFGRVRELHDCWPIIESRLDANKPDTIFALRSVDDNFTLLFRRHDFPDPIDNGDLVVAYLHRIIGSPYVWGGRDCSGIVREAVLAVTGIELPHNADDQRHHPLMVPITPAKARRGDFKFHWMGADGRVDHVSTVYENRPDDAYPPGALVIDTEPSNTGSPGGWPSATLGTGVRVRPAFGGYYCGPDHLVSVARMAAVNGAP